MKSCVNKFFQAIVKQGLDSNHSVGFALCQLMIPVPEKLCVSNFSGQPIKFCVNNNPSSNNKTADCGVIRLSDLPRVNFSFLSVECYAHFVCITFCGQEILFSGANQAGILSSNITDN